MSKFQNPVRGYVPCSTCPQTATVHQIGEGKLIAEGEPPKNGRNLGLLYYRCPTCGNSSMSKGVNQYIEEHQADTAEALTGKVGNGESVESLSPKKQSILIALSYPLKLRLKALNQPKRLKHQKPVVATLKALIQP
ncbi:hypothetical protein [Vibrio atlanticus]|uniref:hypothetical protein n=1 Tax=Vibrio atlanticus TaxID=693153 RepID=UPI00354FC5B8